MSSIMFNDREIFYTWASQSEDNKPTFILLNGMVSDSRVFDYFYADLCKKGYGLLTIDHTNRGASSYLTTPLPYDELVGEIKAVVEAVGVEQPIWIGQSACVGVAIRLAAEIPSKGLVLESPVFTYRNAPRIKMFKSIMEKNLEDETLLRTANFLGFICLSSQFLEKNPHFVMGMLMMIRQLYTHNQFKNVWVQVMNSFIDDTQLVAALSCPTLVLYGREEFLQPLHLTKEFLSHSPYPVDYHELNTGHFIISEAPNAMFDLMDQFAQKLDR